MSYQEDERPRGVAGVSPGPQDGPQDVVVLGAAGVSPKCAATATEPEREGQLVPGEYIPDEWPGPSVLLQKLRDNEWEEEPISKTWAQFFPDIAKDEKETYRYPMPMSDEFWGLHAEPVDAFFNGANALWRTIQDLIHINPIATATTEDAVSVRRGVKTLNALVAPVATLSMN